MLHQDVGSGCTSGQTNAVLALQPLGLQFIGMVSVAPTYADQLDLSKFQTGLIFAVSGAATAVAAIATVSVVAALRGAPLSNPFAPEDHPPQ